MRWLIATDDFPPCDGGVATWTAAVADALQRAGHEVVVLARARPGLGQGVPYRVVGVRGPSFARWGGLWTALAALGRRPDRILATTWPVATALRGAPLDVVVHGSDLTRPARDPSSRARVLRGASRRFAVSHYLAERLAREGLDAEVLPPPIDAGPPRPPAQAGPWGMVGRATALKGGDRFVRLVAAADVRGVVIGDGPARPSWEALARRLGADVRFLGRLDRDAVRAEVSGWSLAALLPRTAPDGSGAEGYGLALAEAAALGVATVGCRTGGVPEAVGGGLVLDDPDDVSRSVVTIRDWLRPDRGEACLRHLIALGGSDAVAARLAGPRSVP